MVPFETLHYDPAAESERVNHLDDSAVKAHSSAKIDIGRRTSSTHVEPPIHRCLDGPTMAVIRCAEIRLTSSMAPLLVSHTET